jgi:hypothetical protein
VVLDFLPHRLSYGGGSVTARQPGSWGGAATVNAQAPGAVVATGDYSLAALL